MNSFKWYKSLIKKACTYSFHFKTCSTGVKQKQGKLDSKPSHIKTETLSKNAILFCTMPINWLILPFNYSTEDKSITYCKTLCYLIDVNAVHVK